MVCLANFAAFGSFYFLLATLPVYIIQVGGKETETGLIIGIFATTALLLRPFLGRVADVKGKKITVVLGALILSVSGLLYNEATTVPLLLVLRAFHGIGWAAFGTAASALVADIVPAARRGEAMGYYGMFINLAMAIGPATGVFLQKSSGFSTLFLSSAGIAFGAFLISLKLSEPSRPGIENPRRGGNAPLLVRSALFPSLILCLLALTYASVVSFLPLFARERELGNPGLFFTVYAIISISTRSVAGWLSDRYGRASVIVPGLFFSFVALLLLSRTFSLPMLLMTAFIYGLSFAAVQPALMALAIDRVSPFARGAAMGTFTAAMDLGIGVGSFIWGFMAEKMGYASMYAAAGAVSLVGLVIFVLGKKKAIPPTFSSQAPG